MKHGWFAPGFFLSVSLFAVPVAAQAWRFGPDNYHECIIEYTKGVTNERISESFIPLCRLAFSEDRDERRHGRCVLKKSKGATAYIAVLAAVHECGK